MGHPPWLGEKVYAPAHKRRRPGRGAESPGLCGWMLAWLALGLGGCSLLLKRTDRIDPDPLQQAVLNTEATLKTRQAALAEVEKLPLEQRVSLLAGLLRRLNHQAAQARRHATRLQRDVLAALQRALSEPGKPPGLAETLREPLWGNPQARLPGAVASSDPEVVVAALKLWATAEKSLPPEAAALAEHPSGKVRRALMHTARGSPQLLWKLCNAALAGNDPSLQQEAARHLGHLVGTAWQQQARRRLEQILQQEGELLRAAAAEALASWGDPGLMTQAGRDRSWRVRQAVARQLKRLPPQSARPLALRLLQDASAVVQKSAVEALAAWPPQWSVPLWCHALNSSAYATRAAAKEQLSRHLKAAAEFPLSAPPQRRRRLAQELLQTWLAETHRRSSLPPAPGTATPGKNAETPLPASVAQELASLLRQAQLARHTANQNTSWRAAMLKHRQALPRWLEQQLLAGTDVQAVLDDELLEGLGGMYRLLARWREASAPQRRALARQLRLHATRRRLGPLVHYLLWQRLAGEQDPLVWQAVLQALAGEESLWAVQLARLGTTHADPEVRRQACLYLRDHPQADHFPWLVPRTEDAQTPVVLAATEALGRCGHPQAEAVLKRLLLASQGNVQAAAAEALAKHNPEQGRRALERLCWHRQWQVRRRAAESLGRLAHPGSTPVLLRLLDDVPEVRQAALQALARSSGLTPPQHVRQRGAEALAQWWRQRLEKAETGAASAPRALQ